MIYILKNNKPILDKCKNFLIKNNKIINKTLNNYMKDMKDNKEKLDIRAAFDDDDNDEKYSSSKKPDSKSTTPVLDTYSRDLTKMAEEGKIDPIIGREKEIERVSQILSRRKKNNPILIGEPGCVDGDTVITIKKVSDDKSHNIVII
jgi:ATP-dependent Clp protease ATP-binding subunit ClpC